MNKILVSIAILIGCAVASPQTGFARGCGGARGGGGESRSREGGYSGSHYSGSHEGGYNDGDRSSSRQGSYNGADYSGSHEGSYSGSRQGTYNGAAYHGSHEANYGGTAERSGAYGAAGYHAGGTEYGAAGYHAGGAEYGAAGYHTGYDATAVGVHAASPQSALPTDGGFATVGATAGTRSVTGVSASHLTAPVNGAYAVARGTAVNNSFNHPGMFGQDWYGAHPGAWQATGWPADRCWTAASWPALGATIGLASGVQPISYNYGTNVAYQGDQVYTDGQPVATADEYYQQATSLAQAAPPVDANDAGWTPLGTFGLVRSEDTDPSYVMQLAVNTSGAVAGNYCDMLTDHNLPLHGSVDPMTQKLAWTVGKNTKVVGEVGLYNLTSQSEAPALIHIGKDKTQQWLLVKLKQPAPAAGQ